MRETNAEITKLQDSKWVENLAKRVTKLKGKARDIGQMLTSSDKKLTGLALLYGHEKSDVLAEKVDSLNDQARMELFETFFPKIARYVDKAWQLQKAMPYSRGYSFLGNSAFRCPNHPEASRGVRGVWLKFLQSKLAGYDFGIEWFATQGRNLFAAWECDSLGILLGAAIEYGDQEGMRVYDHLIAAANGQDANFGMGTEIITAFLVCSRPDAWDFLEKLLLSAAREEGLRQAILERMDDGQPGAFRKLLRTILEHDLVRYSSVARAIDVWLGLRWDAASTAKLKSITERLVKYLDDEKARDEALTGEDVESVYIALWTIAFDDSIEALKPSSELLKNSKVGKRFAAVWLLTHVGLVGAIDTALQALEDEDLRVCAVVLGMVTNVWRQKPRMHLFEQFERLYHRFPQREQKLNSPLWPWLEIKINRQHVTTAMVSNLGTQPVQKLVPYVQGMSSHTRCAMIDKLTDLQDAEVREAIITLAMDVSSSVREKAIKKMAKLKIDSKEAQVFENALGRKASDLRRGLIALLCNQDGSKALESAKRLLASNDELKIAAGLEILAILKKAGKHGSKCEQLANEFEQTHESINHEQKILLDKASQKKKEFSLADALGLCDLSKRYNPGLLTRHDIRFWTKANEAALQALDDFICRHENTAVKINGTEVLLANTYLPFPDPAKNIDEDIKNLPLSESWKNWWYQRAAALRDPDGLELVRMFGLTHLPAVGYPRRKLSGKNIKETYGNIVFEKLKHPHLVRNLCLWLLKIFGSKETGELSFLLDAAETALTYIPSGQEKEFLREYYQPYSGWLYTADTHRSYFPHRWTVQDNISLYRLQKWVDEPIVNAGFLVKNPKKLQIERRRPDFDSVLNAFNHGIIAEADLYDHLLGPRPQGPYGWLGSFDSLGIATKASFAKKSGVGEKVLQIVNECRQRVIEIELQRGETTTPATGAARSIRCIEGIDNFINILKSLGSRTFTRGHNSYGESKDAILSHFLRVSTPAKNETSDEFTAKISEFQIERKKLIAAALFAPQWASFIETYFKMKGFEDAVWWVHAHTKDHKWFFEEHVKEKWEAQIAERTPLKPEDMLEGAVDVEWFNRVYNTLGQDQWETIYNTAKYASSSGGHTRAQLFADSMLGQKHKKEMIDSIVKRRNQDTVRALGLLPIAKGERRDADLLDRYKVIQEFIRGSRQFGSQRQASEKRAAAIALENLARTAGYTEAMRLQLAMEVKSAQDIASGMIELEAAGVKLRLIINNDNEVDLTIERNGKSLKSIPTEAKKNEKVKELVNKKAELKKQISRMRETFEQMMCKGEHLESRELQELCNHALTGPMVNRLVFAGEGILGYPCEGGKLLEDFAGKREPVKPNELLRIAHCYDLFKAGNWHEWQQECFKAERVQPFKQIFRELYILTDNERAEGKISRRYAGHQINSRQAFALLGKRGWVSKYDEGVRRTFHKQKISAWLEFENVAFTPAEVEGLTLEGVSFTESGKWETVDLIKIEPLIFSEVMRDLDLVVSVAHRGGVDPEASQSTIEMRSDLVKQTLDILKIENVSVNENFAIIEGKLAKYNVHLGSAVTHIAGRGALVIVAVHSQHRGRLFLPFADDDPRTAEVLSKILILARDSEIRDPHILQQIRGNC